MRQIIRALAVIVALSPGIAAAQNLPPATVQGRLPPLAGPVEAIPFATLASQLSLSAGLVVGPTTTVIGDFATWGNGAGSALVDGGTPGTLAFINGGTGVNVALAASLNATGGLVGFSGALGTPISGTLTNATGLPISTGLSGAGTGVLTSLGTAVGSAGAPVINGGVLGTPSSGTLTNATGLPISTGVSGLATGGTTFLTTPTSANLRALLTDETGTGVAYFAGGALGTPSSGTLTNATGLPYTALPALSANQLLGSLTATTPSGIGIPGCSGASNALQWVSGVGPACNTAITATTNANLTGDVTSVGNAATLGNAPVIAKVLTGFTSGAGTVTAADSILSAIQKVYGNDALKLPLAGGTMSGNIAMGGNAITGGGAITGTTITGTSYVGLPTATTSVLGTVKPDGTTITISGGVITSSGGSATAVTVGTTNVVSGTTGRVEFNNAGVLGEYTSVPVAFGGTGDTGTAWTAYTPTVTCGSGSGTWAPTGYYKTIGKTVFVSLNLSLTAVGTCNGISNVTLPVTSATPGTSIVRENNVGAGYFGFFNSSGTVMTWATAANGSPTFATGNLFISSFVYQSM